MLFAGGYIKIGVFVVEVQEVNDRVLMSIYNRTWPPQAPQDYTDLVLWHSLKPQPNNALEKRIVEEFQASLLVKQACFTLPNSKLHQLINTTGPLGGMHIAILPHLAVCA